MEPLVIDKFTKFFIKNSRNRRLLGQQELERNRADRNILSPLPQATSATRESVRSYNNNNNSKNDTNKDSLILL